jgi:hypothetical protein|tara:strand:+ start:267 stop:482 length:216 start_codon:yes stop_codon:yes gene_type:complete
MDEADEIAKDPTGWLVKKAKETGFFSMDEIYEIRQMMSTQEGREQILQWMGPIEEEETIHKKIKKLLDNHK